MARVTVKTLAAELGVSPSTISNAYNKPDQLSVELRERIFAKAAELGYSGPDPAARTLRSGKANVVGVMLDRRLSYAFSDPFATGFLAGISAEVEQAGVSILLLPLAGPGEETAAMMRTANVDAVTGLCPGPQSALEVARQRKLTIVHPGLSEATDDHPDEPHVGIDEVEAGRHLGRHLHRLGHRHIGVLSDSCGGRVDSLARVRGISEAMPGVRISAAYGAHNSRAIGAALAPELLDQADRPTALVALSDVMALGALQAMRARGLTPGRDLTLTGFDDIDEADAAGLTTVRQPIQVKGRVVGRLLLDPATEPRSVVFPTQLIVRASSGPAPI